VLKKAFSFESEVFVDKYVKLAHGRSVFEIIEKPSGEARLEKNSTTSPRKMLTRLKLVGKAVRLTPQARI